MRFGRNIWYNLGDKAVFRAGELSSPAPIQESSARPSSLFRDYMRGLNFQLGKSYSTITRHAQFNHRTYFVSQNAQQLTIKIAQNSGLRLVKKRISSGTSSLEKVLSSSAPEFSAVYMETLTHLRPTNYGLIYHTPFHFIQFIH